MSGLCAWDIETVAHPRAAELFAHKIYEPSSTLSPIDRPPASITKLKNEDLRENRLHEWTIAQAEKIEADIALKKKKDLDNAALYWWSGQVVCISLKPLDEAIPKITIFGDNERDLLLRLNEYLDNHLMVKDLVGMSDFDRPYIIGRCLANKVRIPHLLKNRWNVNGNVDRIFTPAGKCSQLSSLANYAFGIGMHKTGSGADVADMYNEKRWDDLVSYCENDTEIVKEMLKRYASASVL